MSNFMHKRAESARGYAEYCDKLGDLVDRLGLQLGSGELENRVPDKPDCVRYWPGGKNGAVILRKDCRLVACVKVNSDGYFGSVVNGVGNHDMYADELEREIAKFLESDEWTQGESAE